MAILDDIFVRVQPVAGDSAVSNIVTSSAFTGTGTPTLLDEAGLHFWRVAAGTLLKSAASYTMDASTGGITICLRFRRRVNGTDDFLPLAGWLPSAGTVTNCPVISAAGASLYRGRLNSTSHGVTSTSGKGLNVIHTLVWRFETGATNAADIGKLWFNQTGRIGTSPDVTSSGANAATTSYVESFINCQSGAEFDLFDFMVWGAAKTDAECAGLADDVRSMVPAPSGSTPVSFTGTIPTQNAVVGTAFSVNLSSYFSGTLTPFTYAITAGTLPAGLSLSGSTISGTPTTDGNVTGLVITATDTGANTAASNSFAINVAAAASPPSGTVTIGTISVTTTTASVPYTYSASDQTGFEYRLNGGTATTATASPQALTGLTAGTAYTIEIRAINAAGNGAWSAVANFTTTAAPTITLTDLSANNGVLWSNQSGITCDVYSPSTGALVVRKTGLSATAGADLSFTDAALVAATAYTVVISFGINIGVAKVTT